MITPWILASVGLEKAFFLAILETHHAFACRFSQGIGGTAAIAGRSEISGQDSDEGKGDLRACELCLPGSLAY